MTVDEGRTKNREKVQEKEKQGTADEMDSWRTKNILVPGANNTRY
jgi:hypothetical protein